MIMIPISQSEDLSVLNLTPATIGLSLSQVSDNSNKIGNFLGLYNAWFNAMGG